MYGVIFIAMGWLKLVVARPPFCRRQPHFGGRARRAPTHFQKTTKYLFKGVLENLAITVSSGLKS